MTAGQHEGVTHASDPKPLQKKIPNKGIPSPYLIKGPPLRKGPPYRSIGPVALCDPYTYIQEPQEHENRGALQHFYLGNLVPW